MLGFALNFGRLPSIDRVTSVVASMSLSRICEPSRSCVFGICVRGSAVCPVGDLLFTPSGLYFMSLNCSLVGSRYSRAVQAVVAHFIFSFALGQLSMHSPVDRTVYSPGRGARYFSFSLGRGFLSIE